jgi:hypothetical protein
MRVVSWLATPETRRNPETLDALAAEIGVRPATIQRWRSKKLAPLAAEEARFGLVEHLPEVFETLAKKAEDGSPEHIRLFLQIASGHLADSRVRIRGDYPSLDYRQLALASAVSGNPADLMLHTDTTAQTKGTDHEGHWIHGR